MDNYVVSYAQNREDIILSAFFLNKKDGFYVDVGANDPTEHSVTKYFYERGWHGINVEPSPRLYQRLEHERTRDINLNVGVSDKEGKLPFREYEGHGLSTFSKDTKMELEHKGHPLTLRYRDYEVRVRTLEDIFNEHKTQNIDFMKIDVEGYEYEVIAGNDWNKYRPSVLCIEANHIHKDWRPVLKKQGYKKIFNDGLNDYYVDSNKEINFDYIPAMIGRNVVPAYFKDDLEKAAYENESLKNEAKLWKNAVREKDDQIEKLNDYIIESARLKSILKSLVTKIDNIIIVRLRNKTKMRHYYPPMPASHDEQNIEQLLATVQTADKVSFTTRPPLTKRISITFFKIILKAYIFTRHLTFKVLKALIRPLRARKTNV